MTTSTRVSIVEPSRRDSAEEDSTRAQNIGPDTPRERSVYQRTPRDQWKTMTTPSDIGDMMDVINGIEAQSQYSGPIDYLSQGLVINDPIKTGQMLEDHRLTPIPDLYELFHDNPRLKNDVKPIIERYEALLKTYEELFKNAVDSLKNPMTVLETQSIQAYIEAIKYGKLEIERQLGSARYYYDCQLARERAAREIQEAQDAERR